MTELISPMRSDGGHSGRTEEMRKTGGLDRKMEGERRDGRRSWKTRAKSVS